MASLTRAASASDFPPKMFDNAPAAIAVSAAPLLCELNLPIAPRPRKLSAPIAHALSTPMMTPRDDGA